MIIRLNSEEARNLVMDLLKYLRTHTKVLFMDTDYMVTGIAKPITLECISNEELDKLDRLCVDIHGIIKNIRTLQDALASSIFSPEEEAYQQVHFVKETPEEGSSKLKTP